MRYHDPYYDPTIGALSTISHQSMAFVRKFDAKYQAQLNEVYAQIIGYIGDDEQCMHNLLYRLSYIPDIQTREGIAEDLEEKIREVLTQKRKSEEEISQTIKKLDALKHYISQIDDFLRNDTVKEIYQKNNTKDNSFQLDARVYYVLLETKKSYEEFLWFSQTLYHYAHEQDDVTIEAENLPIYTKLFKDKIVAPIPFFCLSLLEAARFRERVLHNIDEPVSVKNFPLELRNFCFDKYIQYETERRLAELKKEYDRPLEATWYEAQMELLTDEQVVINQAKNDHEMSADVVRMSELFIAYLKNEMEIDDVPSAKQQQYCTYIVPDALKTRDEIEADIIRASKRSAQRFTHFLNVYEQKGYLDFRGDLPREIFEYLLERYDLAYSADNFIRFFRSE